MTRRTMGVLWLVLVPAVAASVMAVDYQRPVEAAPSADDIGGGYQVPAVQRPMPRAAWWSLADMALLAVALAASAWIGLRLRSRRGLVALTLACLAYFGFYRKGCVCPIGAIQNVATALADPSYAIPVAAVVFFVLPLAVSLLFGRVFCGGVCPLGAIQDLVLLRPLTVPRRLDRALGWLRYAYLGAAVAYAVRPLAHRDYLICRFDPFVGFFRLTGPGEILMIGGGLLAVGIIIGRPYCRWLCPYGGLLAMFARFSWRGVTITPDKELDCGLCREACPFGAIEAMRAVRSSCLSCARCYPSCPREHVRRGDGPAARAPGRSAE